MTATGGSGAAGIGGGENGDCGRITITGGTVTARSSTGAGIGGGGIYGNGPVGAPGGTIRIEGGTVEASSNSGAGIGGGSGAEGGNVTILGGTVTARSQNGGEAVGRGSSEDGAIGSVALSLGDELLVFDKPAATVPVAQDARIGACRGDWARITSALTPVSYVDADGSVRTCSNYTVLTGREATLSGWYVLGSDLTYTNQIIVSGEVFLILSDGASMTAGAGVTVADGNSLTVYGQTGQTGALTATGRQYRAGIGGGNAQIGGTITLNGGVIEASGGQFAAGIGGGYVSFDNGGGTGGTITVNGGTVTATGGQYAAGIGGGLYGAGGTITITGGTVNATGGSSAAASGSGAGIGTGFRGTGATVEITGGTVNATGGNGGAGIGTGYQLTNNTEPSDITVTISGNGTVVTAVGGRNAAGIGGGSYAEGGTVTIRGENTVVNATGDQAGAGIGGGGSGDGGVVVIEGGTVTATGGTTGAGIGGGGTIGESYPVGSGGEVTITGGTVIASGVWGAGIGGGSSVDAVYGGGDGANVTITGGTVIAGTSEGGGEAIGFGAGGSEAGGLTIDGMKVSASDAVDAEPVAAADRENTCRSAWVKLEECGHSFENYSCHWCGEQEDVPIPYVDLTDASQPNKTIQTWTLLTDQTTLDSGCYVVNADTTIHSRITVNGDVQIILTDGAALTASAGIQVAEGSRLAIYGQTGQTGTLTAIGGPGQDGIGGGDGQNAGTITLSGGTVTAAAGEGGQAIGGSPTLVGMKVFDSEGGDPVAAAARENTCSSPWAKVTVCGHRFTEFSDNGDDHTAICAFCNAEGITEGHSYGSVSYSWAADHNTCTASHICSVCSHEETEESSDISASVSLAATCTAMGKTTYTVTFTNPAFETKSEEVEDIQALGHDLTSHEAQAPTCTEIGWDAYETCSRCDYSTYREIEPLGHDLTSHEAQAPTCTEIGWDAYETCSRCDYSTYAEKEALGHTPGAAVRENEVAATTEKDGSYDLAVYCTVCKAELSRETKTIEKLAPARVGSGGGPNTFLVTVTDAENATVEVSRKIAPANVNVTLTVKPGEGYETEGVNVTGNDGNPVAVTKNDDGTWSFLMPAMGVTVEPVIRQIKTPDACDRFTDVDKDAWYYEAVDWAVKQGLMNGTSDTTFEPNSSTTRAMVVTMLWRLEGEPDGKPSPFTDVKAGSWYEKAVNWAAESGIVKGTSETTFSPDVPITREQLAAILYRYAQTKGQGFTGAWAFPLDFPDAAEVSEYAYEPLCWMTMHRIILGMDDGTLAPKEKATRAQIATLFMRLCGELEQ